MAIDFSQHARQFLADFLTANDFRFEKQVELPAQARTVLFFQSSSLQIGIYYSWCDGEVNWLVGSLQAADADFGTENGWRYLNSLTYSPDGITVEDLLAAVPLKPKDRDQQLAEIEKGLVLLFLKGTDKLAHGMKD